MSTAGPAPSTRSLFANHIREFTADNNQLLGQYFGEKQGWPFYNIPTYQRPERTAENPLRRQRLCAEPAEGSPVELRGRTMEE